MIPRLVVVDEIDGRGTVVSLVGGPYAGYEVLHVPRRARSWRAPRRGGPGRPGRTRADGAALVAARGRAEELLVSLLDPRQRRDWTRRRHFWVSTPYGEVELGTVSDLTFRRNDGRSLVLCALPEPWSDLPDADIWTNLLLKLRASPEEFFAVANYREGQTWRRGPVPVVSGSYSWSGVRA